MDLIWSLLLEGLTEGKEERRPSPVAPISRSVSSIPFSLDLADVNNRTRIFANKERGNYTGNPVNFLRSSCNFEMEWIGRAGGMLRRLPDPPHHFTHDVPVAVLAQLDGLIIAIFRFEQLHAIHQQET
jgi:hypothetical protein